MQTISVDEAGQRDLVQLTVWLNPNAIIRLGALEIIDDKITNHVIRIKKKLLAKTWVLREYNRIKQDPERDVAVVKDGRKISLFANIIKD